MPYAIFRVSKLWPGRPGGLGRWRRCAASNAEDGGAELDLVAAAELDRAKVRAPFT